MARFSGAAFRLVERRMTAFLVAAGVCLTLLLPGDVLWINDEPALILLAMEANRAGVPASAGLPGTVGICYGPLAVWFYQLLLFCTAHPILLVTIKSTLVMLVSLAAIQRLGKELRFDWRLFGALFLLNPFLWHANRILWDNVLLLPLVCWLFALLPAYWRRGSPRTLAGIVALLGGMFWLHPMSAPLIGAFGITLLFRPDLLRRDRWKLAVAGLIEGNFSEEGLAAMSDVQDMTSQMAKELMLGIRDNVEDIAAAFKKMAFENPDREVPEVPAEEAALPPPTVIEQSKRVFTAEQEEKLQAAMVQLEQQKAKRTKKTQQVENQLSLFDSVA